MKVIVSGIEHRSGHPPIILLDVIGQYEGELLPQVGQEFDLDAVLMTIRRHEMSPTPDPEDM